MEDRAKSRRLYEHATAELNELPRLSSEGRAASGAIEVLVDEADELKVGINGSVFHGFFLDGDGMTKGRWENALRAAVKDPRGIFSRGTANYGPKEGVAHWYIVHMASVTTD
jgi:hypothetical protein